MPIVLTCKLAIAVTALGLCAAVGVVSAQRLHAGQMRSELRRGFDLREQQRFSEAVAILERVVAQNPDFSANWPDEKIELHAMGELAKAYLYGGEYEKALSTFESAYARSEKGPAIDSVYPIYIAQCRQALAQAHKTDDLPPAVATTSRYARAQASGPDKR